MKYTDTTVPVLLSGVQPSGTLMLGNYIGAIRHWVRMQDKHRCLFPVVDMHAITTAQDPALLRRRCRETAALYLACGVDPQKSTLFMQSHVPAHAQLAWVLMCTATMGEMGRMTQFKEKAGGRGATVGCGLFTYPVLMAADILLYGTHVVPVGEDQKQHLELTRNLAQRFNSRYGETFIVPQPVIADSGARIMSLQDVGRKMSKSDPNSMNYVALNDTPDEIVRKIRRAVTDSVGVVALGPERPGIANLVTIYAAVTGEDPSAVEEQYVGKGYGEFKADLAGRVVEFLRPVRERFGELIQDREALDGILAEGAEAARGLGEPMLRMVHERVGFVQCFPDPG